MAKRRKQKIRMHKNHEWRTKPGYNIFVANRGEVRFDFPESWVMIDGDDALEFHDKQPPDDDCLLKFSVMHLNPQIDWTGLPLADILPEISKDNPGTPGMDRGEVHYEKRSDCELAWLEGRWLDPSENRDAVTRICLARGETIMPLLTMDFWLDDYDRFSPIWDEVLRSLRLGDYVKDPRTGRVTRLDIRKN